MSEVQEPIKGKKRIKCSNCGAELRYAPGTTELNCEYCNTTNTIDEQDIEIVEKDLEAYLQKQLEAAPTDSITTVECESCGAENPLDETTVGKSCMFCGGHLLMKGASRCDQIRPQAVIPFQIDQREAAERYRKWLNGLWFAPNALKRMQNLPQQLKGIYIPFWTFDAQTNTRYTGMRGVRRTETERYTVTVNGKTETRTRTKTRVDWYPASGRINKFFDDELVLANNKLPQDITQGLHPWNLQALVPFDYNFLRGFVVEGYNVDLKEGFSIGRDQMEEKIRELIKRDIGGDQQRITSMNVKWDELTFKHILLPVFVSAYRYKGKPYRFLVNGQSGKVRGERPYSFWKIAGLVVGVAAAIALLYFIFA